MANIVGTITKVQDYISPKDISLKIQLGTGQDAKIELSANRIYCIPEFQRELRWTPDNVNTLLADTSRGAAFLGNMILSLDKNICEIIDGQQRTTILFLIIAYIKKKHCGRIDIPALCPIDNRSFSGLQKLIDCSFDKDAISSDEWDKIVSTDSFCQIDRYVEIWKVFEQSDLLNSVSRAKTILKNILDSEVNVIISYKESDNSIQFFLDVNLKGVRLDTEDIFKGYLFSQDSREETRSLWKDIKALMFQLNHVKNGKNEKLYPLMKIYEHFFYCNLYTSNWGIENGAALKFGENFCLTESAMIEGEKYYQGSHLIEVINDQNYLQHALRTIKQSLHTMVKIAEAGKADDSFKALFTCTGGEKVDQVDIENCHSMLQKIILDKEVIPKVLVMKYISEYLDSKEHTKAEYKSIYSVFSAAVLFTVLANKKKSDIFYGFVRSESWISIVNEWLYNFVSSSEITKGKLLAAYKFTEGTEDELERYRCKSFAAVCNYVKIIKVGENYKIKITNAQEMGTFLSDHNRFSIEHFIIANSGKLEVKTSKYDIVYEYLPHVKKYRNSLFNYIFIPQTINRDLGDRPLWEKLEVVCAPESGITCNYSTLFSKMISSLPHRYFKQYPSIIDIDAAPDEIHAREILNSYFSLHFADDFLEFAIDFLRNICWNTDWNWEI